MKDQSLHKIPKKQVSCDEVGIENTSRISCVSTKSEKATFTLHSVSVSWCCGGTTLVGGWALPLRKRKFLMGIKNSLRIAQNKCTLYKKTS